MRVGLLCTWLPAGLSIGMYMGEKPLVLRARVCVRVVKQRGSTGSLNC